MAGVTDAAFRARVRRNGCGQLVTEMVSAAALARGNRKTLAYLHPPDRGPDLVIQLFGAVPAELAHAAELAQEAGFSRIDLNMGCPVKKVVRSGAGAALLTDVGRAERCVRALRRVVRGELSVKIRAGWDARSVNCLEVGRLAEHCGVDRITFHGRTRAQGYGGRADWSLVEELASAVSVPVVGNGDVTTAAEAVLRLRRHGCAGVMMGRAAVARPGIFRAAWDLWRECPDPGLPSAAELGADLVTQLEDLAVLKGPRRAVLEMRKFVAWGAKGVPGAAAFRRAVQQETEPEPLRRRILEFFGSAPSGDEGRSGDCPGMASVA